MQHPAKMLYSKGYRRFESSRLRQLGNGGLAEWFMALVLFPICLKIQTAVEFLETNRNPAYGGEVAERFKAAVLKTAISERVS